MANIELTLTPASPTGSMIFTLGSPGAQGPAGPPGPSGVAYATDPLSYDAGTQTVSIDLSDYSTTAQANGLYYPLDGNPSNFIDSSALTGYATESFVNSNFLGLSGGDMGVGAFLYFPDGGNMTTRVTSNNFSIYDILTSSVGVTVNQSGFYAQSGLAYSALTYEGIRFPDATIQTTASTNPNVSEYALLAGATFTGKVNTTVTDTTAPINIGSQVSAPSSTVAGDVWIGANINYKYWDGIPKAVANTNTTNQFTQGQSISVNSALNAFRINQTGTGNALVIEDSTTPDASSFVVNADGNVGIGLSASYIATQKLQVVGNVRADGFLNGAGPIFTVKSVAAHAGGAKTHDIFMSVGGSTYRLPAIFVSTP